MCFLRGVLFLTENQDLQGIHEDNHMNMDTIYAVGTKLISHFRGRMVRNGQTVKTTNTIGFGVAAKRNVTKLFKHDAK